MNTDLEARLAAALRARTDLVTPESLPPITVPEATVTPLVRRPIVWVAGAAAAAVVVALPFALAGRHTDTTPSPAPTGPTTSESPSAARVIGDVDGDGNDDWVTLEDGTLSVLLASSNSGQPLTATVPASYSIAGLVMLDNTGAHPVMVHELADAQIFRVTEAGLTEVTMPGGTMEEPFTGNDWQMWSITDGRLLSGDLPLTPGSEAGVPAQGWRMDQDGYLQSTYLGELCWQTQEHLASCGGGAGLVDQDNLQVSLFPESEVVPAGGSMPIAIDGGGGPGTVTLDGSTLTVDFPGGSPAEHVNIPGEGTNELLKSLVPGGEVPGIVVRQTQSDGYVVFTIVTWRAGHLTVLDTGTQISSWDDHHSWLSSTGHLLTLSPRINGDGAAVQEWQLSDTGVKAVDLQSPDGRTWICFDDTSYDAC